MSDGRRRGRGRGPGDGRCGVEGAGEFEAGDGGDLVVVAAGDAVGGGASEEGADEAAIGRDAVGEFLVDEGAGEQEVGGGIERACSGWVEVGRDEEAEAGRERDAGCVGVAEGDEDGGAGFGGEKLSGGRHREARAGGGWR